MSQNLYAIIPAAGMGTRLRPATLATPKELLPIFDRPSIDLVLEEIFLSGINHVVIVTSKRKPMIREYLEGRVDESFENWMPKVVQTRGGKLVPKIEFVYQEEALGLGHAVYCASQHRPQSDFAVVLPDDLYFSDPETPALGQLVSSYRDSGQSQLGLMPVSAEELELYGAACLETPEIDSNRSAISALVEKPKRGTSDARHAVVGRYVFSHPINSHLREGEKGLGGEIQLTDAIAKMLASSGGHGVIGVTLQGERIDAGTKVGLLRASIREARARGIPIAL